MTEEQKDSGFHPGPLPYDGPAIKDITRNPPSRLEIAMHMMHAHVVANLSNNRNGTLDPILMTKGSLIAADALIMLEKETRKE